MTNDWKKLKEQLVRMLFSIHPVLFILLFFISTVVSLEIKWNTNPDLVNKSKLVLFMGERVDLVCLVNDVFPNSYFWWEMNGENVKNHEKPIPAEEKGYWMSPFNIPIVTPEMDHMTVVCHYCHAVVNGGYESCNMYYKEVVLHVITGENLISRGEEVSKRAKSKIEELKAKFAEVKNIFGMNSELMTDGDISSNLTPDIGLTRIAPTESQDTTTDEKYIEGTKQPATEHPLSTNRQVTEHPLQPDQPATKLTLPTNQPATKLTLPMDQLANEQPLPNKNQIFLTTKQPQSTTITQKQPPTSNHYQQSTNQPTTEGGWLTQIGIRTLILLPLLVLVFSLYPMIQLCEWIGKWYRSSTAIQDYHADLV